MSAPVYAGGQFAVVTVRGQQHNAVRDSSGAWLVGDIEDLRILDDGDGLVTVVQLMPTLDMRDQRTLTRFRELLGEEAVKTTNRAVARALVALTPRPPEPVGLGAVVVDLDGKRWLRDGMDADDGKAWFWAPDATGKGWERRQYDEIQVLEVRSIGDVA